MKTFAFILDPNYTFGGHADFRVHVAGCRDILRHMNSLNFLVAGIKWERKAETAEAAIAAEVACFAAQDKVYTPNDFHICQCAMPHLTQTVTIARTRRPERDMSGTAWREHQSTTPPDSIELGSPEFTKGGRTYFAE